MPRQKLFVLAWLVSSVGAIGHAKKTEDFSVTKDLSVQLSDKWLSEAPSKRLANAKDGKLSCYPQGLNVVGRFFSDNGCCTVMGYDATCKNQDDCSEFDTTETGIGNLAGDCCQSNSCYGTPFEMFPKPPPYSCESLNQYGARSAHMIRFAERKIPSDGFLFLADTPWKGAGVYDETAIKIVRSKKPRLLGILNVVMTCREDAYAAEKPKLDKFLESIKFRGKPLVEPGHDWSPQPPVR